MHTGYVDKADRMTNSYSISRRTWKWTKKIFFHLLDLMILNSFILMSSCGAKLSHRDFRLALVCNMLEHAGMCRSCPRRPLGRPPALSSIIFRLMEAIDITGGPLLSTERTAAFILLVARGEASTQNVM
jgi:hypothetical protein